MGFRTSVQLSLCPWASDPWQHIVIIVNDSRAARMYWRNGVRWCVIIANDGASSLRRPLGCIGRKDGLSSEYKVVMLPRRLVIAPIQLSRVGGLTNRGKGKYTDQIPCILWCENVGRPCYGRSPGGRPCCGRSPRGRPCCSRSPGGRPGCTQQSEWMKEFMLPQKSCLPQKS
jgi:hypothetical protein